MAATSTRERDLPVLIAGGGIGGLAVALALSRQGWRCEVFEQARQFKEIGAGIQLGPNAFQMLDVLNLSEEVLQVAALPESLLAMDGHSGAELARIPTGDAFTSRFGHPYALVHRADLHAILVRACRRSPLVKLHSGRKVLDFNDRGDRVEVVLQDHEVCQGAALIGADGLWSTIRGRLFGEGKPRVSGHIAYRAVMPASEVPEVNRRNSMVVWFGPKTHLVHYPLRRGDLFNLVAVFHSDRYEEGWDTYGDPSELHERFAGSRQEVRGMLEKIDAWRMWVLCDRDPIREWSKGRVALAGDAAHPMLQYLAQGAVMALEDSVCLAKKAVAAEGDFARAFQAYAETRYLRAGRVQLMARLYGEVYHACGVARELRNHLLQARTVAQSYDSFEWLYSPREVEAYVS